MRVDELCCNGCIILFCQFSPLPTLSWQVRVLHFYLTSLSRFFQLEYSKEQLQYLYQTSYIGNIQSPFVFQSVPKIFAKNSHN